MWSGGKDSALALDRASKAGLDVARLVSFYDSHIPAFITIAIDKKTRRALELWLVAPAHFMHHTYTHFNQPLGIVPPH